MPAILESPPHALSIAELARISQQLADEVSRLPLLSEGFSVADYLSLDGNYFVEYSDGRLQVLPMPSGAHQDLAAELMFRLKAWSRPDPEAWTRLAPFRVMLSDRYYREPDVCFMLGRNAARRHANYWDGADLVVEIISESNRDHDEVTKRREYAGADIPEYWIVDPDAHLVRVLTLTGVGPKHYATHGEFGLGEVATSVLLPGFAVDVSELFAATDPRA